MPIDTSMWANLARPQGESPLDTYLKLAQFRQMQQHYEQQNKLAALQIQREQMATNELQRQSAQAEAVRGAYSGAVVPQQSQTVPSPTLNVGGVDLGGGQQTISRPAYVDPSRVMANLSTAAPEQALAFQQSQDTAAQARQKQMLELQTQLATLDKTHLENVSKQMGIMGQLGQGFLANPNPNTYTNMITGARNIGVDATQYGYPAQFTPDVIPLVQQHVNEAMSVKDAADAAHAAQTAKETGRHNLITESQAATNAAETRRHNLVGEADTNAPAPLSPDAQAMVARQYATTGQLPGLGMGKAGAAQRAQIINTTAQSYPGLNPGTSAAIFSADKKSLGQVQGTLDSITAFENTAKKNLDVFLNTAKNVVDTGVPWINKPLRSIAGGLGGTDQTAYDTARQTVVPEIARILNNPSLSGALSDSARGEISTLIRPDASLKQIYQAAQILTTDMGNRKDSLTQQRDAIKSRLGNNAVVTAPLPGTPPASPQGFDWNAHPKVQ